LRTGTTHTREKRNSDLAVFEEKSKDRVYKEVEDGTWPTH